MSERSEQVLAGLIKHLQASERPMERWAAVSIDEIYMRDEYSLARVKGSHDPNLKYTP